MPYDVVAANRAATQTGASLGATIAQNFYRQQEQGIRMQQLQSERALRQLQERQAAETLNFAIHQHQAAIQEEADNAKKSAVFQSMITPTLQLPSDTGESSSMEVPNPHFQPDLGKAYIEAFMPGARDPAKVLLNGATIQLHQAQAMDEQAQAATRGMPTPRAPSQVAADEALAQQRLAGAELNKARTKEVEAGKTKVGADPDWIRSLKFYEDRTGKKLSDTEIKELWDVRSGLKPKAAVTRAKSEGDFISQHIDKVMEQPVIPAGKDKQGGERFRLPKSRKEAVDYLRGEYSTLFEGAGPSAPPPTTTTTPAAEEEKVIVVSPDGRKGRIPRSQLEQAIKQGYKEYEG